MIKKDNIYKKGNFNDLPFSFNKEVAEVFDDMIDRSVPGYISSLRLIQHITNKYFQENTNCYDLGCSLGAATESLFKATEGKEVKIIAFDNSNAMIDSCKYRYKDQINSGKVQFIEQDIADVEINNASIVVINFVLQFLDSVKRTSLLKIVYEGLIRGGKLVISEKIHFESKFRTDVLSKLHHRFKAENGYTAMEISRKRDALEGILVTESETQHAQRLESIGFKRIRKVMSNLNFMTLVAEK